LLKRIRFFFLFLFFHRSNPYVLSLTWCRS
jgi:hypothetical protein